MIGRNVLALLEVQTIYTMSSIEYTIYLNAIHIEVRLDFIVRDIEHLLLHLGRIVEAVVWLELEVLALALLCVSFDFAGLGICLRSVFLDEALQEVVYVLGILGHRLLQRIIGIGAVAHQLSLLGTELGNLGYDREGVEHRVGTVGTVDACHVNLAAELTVLEIGEDSLLGSVHDDDAVWSLVAQAFCIFLALCDVGVAESGKFFLAVHPNHRVVGSCRKKIAKLLLEV